MIKYLSHGSQNCCNLYEAVQSGALCSMGGWFGERLVRSHEGLIKQFRSMTRKVSLLGLLVDFIFGE